MNLGAGTLFGAGVQNLTLKQSNQNYHLTDMISGPNNHYAVLRNKNLERALSDSIHTCWSHQADGGRQIILGINGMIDLH